MKSFYEIEEAVASKGIADWKMLRRKLPDELFLDRRTLPHELFGRAEVEMYLEALEHAIDAQLAIQRTRGDGSKGILAETQVDQAR